MFYCVIIMAWESIQFVEKNPSITWIYHHLSIHFLKFSVGVVYRFEHCTCMSLCGCAYLCMSTWMQGVYLTLYFFFTILQLNFWDKISSLNIAVIISLQWMTIGLFLSLSLPPLALQVTGMNCHYQHLQWHWGSELNFLCLYNKHLIH